MTPLETTRTRYKPILWIEGACMAFFLLNNATFNPMGRFSETPPNVYRNISDVLQMTGSPELRREIQQALNRDGKLTQANMGPVWRAWEKALPTNGYTVGAVSPEGISLERERVIVQVGATPENSVWTPLTD